jgi:GT2 family glycosyltransferase
LTSASIDVVIVNWNSGPHLDRCVRSLLSLRLGESELRVIVVDNASTDGSLDSLPNVDSLEVIHNPVNSGFAAACNLGARAGKGDFILFLNPDTVVQNSAALKLPQDILDENPNVGISSVQLRDESGNVSRTCTRFPTATRVLTWATGIDRIFPKLFGSQFMTDFDHLSRREVDVVMGAFYMIRRALFEQLKGFDERYFVYYEEVDLCRRAKNAGFSSLFVPDVHVTHIGHGTTESIKATRYFYSARSKIIYGFAHFSRLGALVSAGVTLLLEPLFRVAFFALNGNFAGVWATLVGAVKLWGWSLAPSVWNSGIFTRGRQMRVTS